MELGLADLEALGVEVRLEPLKGSSLVFLMDGKGGRGVGIGVGVGICEAGYGSRGNLTLSD